MEEIRALILFIAALVSIIGAGMFGFGLRKHVEDKDDDDCLILSLFGGFLIGNALTIIVLSKLIAQNILTKI